jgi:hypothetical protein
VARGTDLKHESELIKESVEGRGGGGIWRTTERLRICPLVYSFSMIVRTSRACMGTSKQTKNEEGVTILGPVVYNVHFTLTIQSVSHNARGQSRVMSDHTWG